MFLSYTNLFPLISGKKNEVCVPFLRFGRKKATAIPLCIAFVCARANVLLQMYDVNDDSGVLKKILDIFCKDYFMIWYSV